MSLADLGGLAEILGAVGVIISQLEGAERHPKAIDYGEVDTHTTGGFNLAALVVVLMLVGLYATWW